jgi:hypothetical protein
VLVAIVVVLIATMSDAGKKTVAASPRPTTVPAPTAPPRVKLVIGRVIVRSVGPRAHVRRPLRRALRRAAQRYVDSAIIAPLEQGRAIPGYGKMYDPGVKRLALGRDLAKLTEVKMGFRRKRVHATASKVRVDAIGNLNGRPALVALTFSLNIDAATPKGRLAIRRHTELTFAREFGRWLVTAYQVDVSRSLGKKKAKTAAAHAG